VQSVVRNALFTQLYEVRTVASCAPEGATALSAHGPPSSGPHGASMSKTRFAIPAVLALAAALGTGAAQARDADVQ